MANFRRGCCILNSDLRKCFPVRGSSHCCGGRPRHPQLTFPCAPGNTALKTKPETCFKDDTTSCELRKIPVADRPSKETPPGAQPGRGLGWRCTQTQPSPACEASRALPPTREAPSSAIFTEQGQLAPCPACSRESTGCAGKEEEADGGWLCDGKD